MCDLDRSNLVQSLDSMEDELRLRVAQMIGSGFDLEKNNDVEILRRDLGTFIDKQCSTADFKKIERDLCVLYREKYKQLDDYLKKALSQESEQTKKRIAMAIGMSSVEDMGTLHQEILHYLSRKCPETEELDAPTSAVIGATVTVAENTGAPPEHLTKIPGSSSVLQTIFSIGKSTIVAVMNTLLKYGPAVAKELKEVIGFLANTYKQFCGNEWMGWGVVCYGILDAWCVYIRSIKASGNFSSPLVYPVAYFCTHYWPGARKEIAAERYYGRELAENVDTLVQEARGAGLSKKALGIVQSFAEHLMKDKPNLRGTTTRRMGQVREMISNAQNIQT